MVQAKFTPILLGSDINVYGMARSFNEAYGIKVQAWAASQLAATRYSKIVDVEVHEGFEEDPGFMNVMKQKSPRTSYFNRLWGWICRITC